MEAFLAEILAFPTVIFTICLGLILVYWFTVILGVLDLDAFDSAGGAADGGLDALDGAGDALEAKAGMLDGAAEALEAKAGMLDGAAEALEAKAGMLDGAAEALEAKAGFLDGAAEAIEAKTGALDGAAEAIEAKTGALDGAAEALEGGADAADAAAMGAAKGRSRVPVTIRFSLWTLGAWATSFLLVHNLSDTPTDAGLPLMLGAGAGAAVAGWLFARVAAMPLAKVFHVAPAKENKGLVGKECTITTGKVDDHFGQARVEDGGAGLVIHVRCEPGKLKRHDKAIIVQWNPGEHAFDVAPLDDFGV